MTVKSLPLTSTAQDLQSAISSGGFVSAFPVEMSSQPRQLVTYDGMRDEAWFRVVHESCAEVGPLGCSFLKNITITGFNYAFDGDTILSDGTHISNVMVDWFQRGYPHRLTKKLNRIFVSDPMLNILGPGHGIYGHWLVDFLPRLHIARSVLGATFGDYKVPIPFDTPTWARALAVRYLGLEESKFFEFDPEHDLLQCSLVCIPTYIHGPEYHFHSEMRAFLHRFLDAPASRGTRRICISRRNYEGLRSGVPRLYKNRKDFELIAKTNGFEVVCPEDLSQVQQVQLFSEASAIVGEYGSALHNSVFAPPGSIIGAIRCPNSIQSRLTALLNQNMCYLIPEEVTDSTTGLVEFCTSTAEIERFVEAVLSV